MLGSPRIETATASREAKWRLGSALCPYVAALPTWDVIHPHEPAAAAAASASNKTGKLTETLC